MSKRYVNSLCLQLMVLTDHKFEDNLFILQTKHEMCPRGRYFFSCGSFFFFFFFFFFVKDLLLAILC